MPIVDLQRRIREIGRIRLGDKTDKGAPRKLASFRLTSRDQVVIEAAAERYGGQVKPWEARDGGQWQVTTKVNEMPVIVPPTDLAFSQWYEAWTAAGCQKRCDGRLDVIADSACSCDPEDRVCAPHTRLSLILHELPGLGVWRLESSGWAAATELASAVELVRGAATIGQLLPARLRLEQRESRKPGEQIKKFAVPVLDLDVSITALQQLGSPAFDVETGEIVSTPSNGLSPVPALPVASVPSIAEQVAAAQSPAAKPARSNAAEPIKRTGVKPRPRGAQVSGPSENGEGHTGTGPSSSKEGGAVDDAPPSDDGGTLPLASRVALWIKDIEPEGLDSAGSDDYRHQFMKAFTGGKSESAKSVTPKDLDNLHECIDGIRKGELGVGVDENGWWLDRFLLLPVSPPSPTVAKPEDRQGELEVWDEHRWAREIDGVSGIGTFKLLKRARTIAEEHGWTVPKEVGEITQPELVAAVRTWLQEQA